MAEKFEKGKHTKADIFRAAMEALGGDAPNGALKTWINERYSAFPWSANPSAELANAKKLDPDAESEESPKATRASRPASSPAPDAVEVEDVTPAEPGPAVTAGAVIKALKRIGAMPADERAALDKALKAIEQFGSAEAAQIAIRKVTELMS